MEAPGFLPCGHVEPVLCDDALVGATSLVALGSEVPVLAPQPDALALPTYQ